MLRQGICRGALLVTLAPAALAVGLASNGLDQVGAAKTVDADSRPTIEARRGSAPVPRIECPAPQTLRLRRFEDGSAQVLCARRVIVRISVPG